MARVIQQIKAPFDGIEDPTIEGQLVEVLDEPDAIGLVQANILTGVYQGEQILIHVDYIRPYIRTSL